MGFNDAHILHPAELGVEVISIVLFAQLCVQHYFNSGWYGEGMYIVLFSFVCIDHYI